MRIHFAIPVKDLETSRKFYEGLGLAYTGSWQKPDERLEAAVLENEAGARVELVYHPHNAEVNFSNIPEILHIGFSVPAIELLLEGKEILKPITKGVSVKEFAFIRDPNGFPVELVVER